MSSQGICELTSTGLNVLAIKSLGACEATDGRTYFYDKTLQEVTGQA